MADLLACYRAASSKTSLGSTTSDRRCAGLASSVLVLSSDSPRSLASQEEERADCKTPLAWRLTSTIRREFVKTMRTVALLSMFSRDPLTIGNSQAALKTMGYLEPDLIFPAILERAWPALEDLLEVRRSSLTRSW